MKRYDRRTFLKLSGASAVMLALSACDDTRAPRLPGPPAPQAPALPQKRLSRRRSL